MDKERQERRKASLCRLLARKEQRALQQVGVMVIGSARFVAPLKRFDAARLVKNQDPGSVDHDIQLCCAHLYATQDTA